MDTQSIAGRLENLIKAKIENLVADLIQNQNELPLEKNVDQQILVTIMSGALYNASLTYFRKDEKRALDSFIDEVLTFVLSGMNKLTVGD